MNLDHFIEKTIAENAEDHRVLAFPLQCGIGKTSHIRRMIAKHLTDGRGIIVVTDTINGLKTLAGLPPNDKAFQDYLDDFQDQEQKEAISYLNANRDRIAFLDHETIRREIPFLYRRNGKPIVLMTTQRYSSLSREEIQNLTSGAIHRDLIVFDEKPIFVEQVKISVEHLNEVDTALKIAIDNTAIQENKTFIIEYWNHVKEEILGLFAWNENQTKAGRTFTIWHDPSPEIDTINREKFERFINETYHGQLDMYSSHEKIDIRKTIKAVLQALTDGATFTSRKKSERKAKDGSRYENYLTSVVGHADLFIDVGAQIVVFDGTADIHPDYDLDYIKLVNCTAYKPRLNNLTIGIANINTTKTHLRQNKQLLEKIGQDIHARYGNPVIFCHMEREKELFSMGFSDVDHFGNLKGRNNWRDAETIVQIGTNRFPDEAYHLMTYYNIAHTTRRIKRNYRKLETIQAKLEGREPEYSNLPCDDDYHIPSKTSIISENAIIQTRNRSIVADIEQNLFRGSIRRGKPMQFIIYTNAFQYDKTRDERMENGLVGLLRDRYETVGAKIDIIDAPAIKILCRHGNKQKETTAQKIIGWLRSQPEGYSFKLKTMLDDLGLTNHQFQMSKKTNRELEKLFSSMKSGGLKGWYCTRSKYLCE